MVVIEIRTEFWQENLKSPLGIPGHRQEDNIKMGPKIGCEAVGQIHQAQGMDQWRCLGNAVINLRILQNSGNFLTEKLLASQ
jgi:hypothetical protein